MGKQTTGYRTGYRRTWRRVQLGASLSDGRPRLAPESHAAIIYGIVTIAAMRSIVQRPTLAAILAEARLADHVLDGIRAALAAPRRGPAGPVRRPAP